MNVVSLGSAAFYSAKLEGDLNLPKCAGTLSECFRNANITSANIPLVTKLNSEFHYNQKLKKVVTGEGLVEIAGTTFRGCILLEVVVMKATTPPTLSSESFVNSTISSIYVADESVEAYKAATNWSNFATKIKPLSEYEG